MASSHVNLEEYHPSHHHHHHHPHHHPHHDISSGASSSASAARCPYRPTTDHGNNYQPPAIPSGPSSTHYDTTQRDNRWQSRAPLHWQPAMIPPYTLGSPAAMGLYSGPTASNQPAQSQQPLCPMPANSSAPNLPDPNSSQTAALHQYRPMMHPAPRFLAQRYPTFGGRVLGNYRTVSNSHQPSANFMQTGQTGQGATFSNENRGSDHQLPNLPQLFTAQNLPTPPSQQTPEPTSQTTGLVEDGATGSVTESPSAPAPASAAPPQATRIINPVEIRRASTTTANRARRTMTRYSAAPELLNESTLAMRRDLSMMDAAENFPGTMADGEGVVGTRYGRGHALGKRIASKMALASLQSVDVSVLPESERTCVICYNEFGVESPEGINEAPLRLPKCKHVFGDHCIKKWFQESDSCPYCRDKVHSDPLHPRRANTGFRLMPPYQGQGTIPHLSGYQALDPHSLRDPEVSVRATHRNASVQERRSPPAERRRNRQRLRVSPGGTPSNTASQSQTSSARPSRSSRSRSPAEYPGQSGGFVGLSSSGASVFDMPSYAMQSRVFAFPAETFLNRPVSPSRTSAMDVNEHPSELPQMHPNTDLRFSSPPTAPIGHYEPVTRQLGSNQFTSYQQS
ncbi:hypothetical protein F4808DRAFT_320711 [Astrocystis sublimbata]|nr:hypothetical protein F4808DRAFT_320711 [Astrocystis sublimbata]